MAEKKSIITPHFRVSYPKVFEPELNELNNKMEYSLVAVFPKGTDKTAMNALCAAAMKEKWGDKKPRNMKNPMRSNDDRKNDDGVLPQGYEEGGFFCTMKARQQPGIIDRKRKPILDPEEFYAGCWAHADVVAFAYEEKGNCGVSFWVSNIQKVKDDEPISGRRKAEEVFSALDDDEEDKPPVADPFAD